MNNFLNEYFGFYFELNIELNHFLARFNEKMNIQNVSTRAKRGLPIPESRTLSHPALVMVEKKERGVGCYSLPHLPLILPTLHLLF